MKTNLKRLLVSAAAALLVLCAVLPAAAAELHRVVILDDKNLLTSAQEEALAAEMRELAAYGDVAFWTTDQTAYDEVAQAQEKRHKLFGSREGDSSAIFVINTRERKLTIQSFGAINEMVTDSKARSITNNVRHDAMDGDYFACAVNAYRQMLTVVEGNAIAEPMKWIGFVFLALAAAVVVILAIAFSRRSNPLTEETDQFAPYRQPQPISHLDPSQVELAYGISGVNVVNPQSASAASGGQGGAAKRGSDGSAATGCLIDAVLMLLEVLVSIFLDGGGGSGGGGGFSGFSGGSGGSSSY